MSPSITRPLLSLSVGVIRLHNADGTARDHSDFRARDHLARDARRVADRAASEIYARFL